MSFSLMPDLKKIVTSVLFVSVTIWVSFALVFGLPWHMSRYVWKTVNPPEYDYKADAVGHFARFGLLVPKEAIILGFNTGYNPFYWALLDAIKGPPYTQGRKTERVQLTAQLFRIEKAQKQIKSWESSLLRYCQERSAYLACEVQPSIQYESLDKVFFGIGSGSRNGTLAEIKLKKTQVPTFSFWFDETTGIALLKVAFDDKEFGRTSNYASGKIREWIKEH